MRIFYNTKILNVILQIILAIFFLEYTNEKKNVETYDSTKSKPDFNFEIIRSIFDTEKLENDKLHEKEIIYENNDVFYIHLDLLKKHLLDKFDLKNRIIDNNEEFHSGDKLNSNLKTFKEDDNVFKTIRESFITVVMFHAHWCGHCKHFLPILKEISNINFLQKVNFYEVECSGELKFLCEEFAINKYPTLKIYYKGKELNFEPSRDKNSLTELLVKLIDNRIINVSSLEELNIFNEYYGDLSYLYYSNIDKIIKFINENCLNDNIIEEFVNTRNDTEFFEIINDSKNILDLQKSELNHEKIKSFYLKLLKELDAIKDNYSQCLSKINEDVNFTPYLYFGKILNNKDEIKTHLLESTLSLNETNMKCHFPINIMISNDSYEKGNPEVLKKYGKINGVLISGKEVLNINNKNKKYKNFEFSDCKNFSQEILNNQFPFFKQLSMSYLRRLQQTKLKMNILVVNVNNNDKRINKIIDGKDLSELSLKSITLNEMASMGVLADYYSEKDLKDMVFTYLNYSNENDAKILEYFKLDPKDIPSIILYDFEKKKYYVDRIELNTVKDFIVRTDKLLKSNLKWTSGNFLEDFFAIFGIELNSTSLMILIILIIISLFSILYLCTIFLSKEDDKQKLINLNSKNKKDQENTVDKEKKD